MSVVQRLLLILAMAAALSACQRAAVPLAATPTAFQGAGWKAISGTSTEFGYNGYACPKADCPQPAVAMILRGTPSNPPAGSTVEAEVRKKIGNDADLRKQINQANELALLRASVQSGTQVQSQIRSTRRVLNASGAGLDIDMTLTGGKETLQSRTLMTARGNQITVIIAMSPTQARTNAIFNALMSAAK
jgi:hypothetical protein